MSHGGKSELVVVVHALSMVHAVRLRTLDHVAQPLRRAHVPVLEHAGKREQVTGDGRREWIEPEHQHRDSQRYHGVGRHFERMKQHRPGMSMRCGL